MVPKRKKKRESSGEAFERKVDGLFSDPQPEVEDNEDEEKKEGEKEDA